MTESEFQRQVWRAFDFVELEDGSKYRVSSVCFPTRSIRVRVGEENKWYRCESITRHIPATGQPDDLAIIADLHNKLMAAQEKIEDMNQKMQTGSISELRKCINILGNNLTIRKDAIARIDEVIERINIAIDRI